MVLQVVVKVKQNASWPMILVMICRHFFGTGIVFEIMIQNIGQFIIFHTKFPVRHCPLGSGQKSRIFAKSRLFFNANARLAAKFLSRRPPGGAAATLEFCGSAVLPHGFAVR